MAIIYPLFSSSSGNACYIGSSEAGILIDAGTSCKRLCSALERCGINREAIKAIFITHDHSDHIGALRVFTKCVKAPIFASKGTLRFLENSDMIDSGCETAVADESGTEICGFSVEAYHTPHDAMESVFYRIHTPDGKTACICTDLGHVPAEIDLHLRGADIVLLESNYDENMLRCGPYPYNLKLRISGELGHLSNSDCAKEVRKLVSSGTRRIILGHLSRHNNLPELAEAAVLDALGRDFIRNRDYILNVAPIETAGKGMSF